MTNDQRRRCRPAFDSRKCLQTCRVEHNGILVIRLWNRRASQRIKQQNLLARDHADKHLGGKNYVGRHGIAWRRGLENHRVDRSLTQCFGNCPDSIFDGSSSGQQRFIKSHGNSIFVSSQQGHVSNQMPERGYDAIAVRRLAAGTARIRLLPDRFRQTFQQQTIADVDNIVLTEPHSTRRSQHCRAESRSVGVADF